MQGHRHFGTLLTAFLFASAIATGAALAGGTPNDAAGAQGHDAPSSAEPTPDISDGSPDAKVLPDDTDLDAPQGEYQR